MRAREFLIEYRRDITLNRFRSGLTAALKRLSSSHVDDDLYQAHWIVANQKTNPLAKPITVTVFGDKITISNENMAEVAEQIMPKLLERTVEFFERVDPTPQKKYVPWMIQAFINDPNDSRMEDYNGNNLLGLYDRYKSSLRPEHRDINKFKTYGEFVSWIWDYGLQNRAAEKIQERGKYEIVYEDDTVRVVHPLDEQASIFWGRGTIWCTAATESTNRFERYNQAGPLYILLPKKPAYEGEKYQIHVANGEWADEQNDQKNIKLFQTKFPGFMDWIMQREPELKNAVVFADPDEIDKLLAIFREATLEHVYEVLNIMEMEDDYYQEHLYTSARERGYIDDNDDVDWDKVDNDDDLTYLNYSDNANRLLKTVIDVFNSTGQQFQGLAEEMDEHNGGIYSMDQFEELISEAIKQEAEDYRSRSTNELISELREWIHYNFTIYPKTRPPKYDNPRWNKIGSTDNYLVYKSKTDNSR